MNYDLIETKDEAEFIAKATSFVSGAIAQAISERGRCIMGLSGGKTPKEIYSALAQDTTIEWGRVHLFLTDERYVPADHADSNQALIKGTLLRYGGIDDPERLVFPNTALELKECVRDYDARLKTLLADAPADLLILGIGEDGHITSLFPPVSKDAFGDAYAIHTMTDAFAVHDRISMTIPPMHAAHRQCFFLNGEAKKNVWEEMIASEEGPERWPAKGVMAMGETTIFARW